MVSSAQHNGFGQGQERNLCANFGDLRGRGNNYSSLLIPFFVFLLLLPALVASGTCEEGVHPEGAPPELWDNSEKRNRIFRNGLPERGGGSRGREEGEEEQMRKGREESFSGYGDYVHNSS